MPGSENASGEINSKIILFSIFQLVGSFNHLRKPIAHQYICPCQADLSLAIQEIAGSGNQRQIYPQFTFYLQTPYGVGVTVMLEEVSVLYFIFYLKKLMVQLKS